MFTNVPVKPRRLWLAGLVLLLASRTAAADATGWSLRVWKSDEGLPDNTVAGIAQTADGFLWVATQGGLVRFDGIEFREFAPANAAGLPTGLMRGLCVDNQNRLWVAKDRTVVACLDVGRNTIFTTENGLPVGRAKSMVADGNGDLWVAYSGRHVVRIRNGQVRSYTKDDGLPDSSNCQVVCDRDQHLWYLSRSHIGCFRDDQFVSLALLHGACSIARARSGGVWVCAKAQVFHCNADGELTLAGELPVADQSATTTALYEDRTGSLWIAVSGSGLFRFDGSTFQHVETSPGDISCLYGDREGNLWVGTVGGGLNRLRERIVELQNIKSGAPFGGLQSVCRDTTGVLWATDRSGIILRNEGNGWRPLTEAEGWTNHNVTCVAADPTGGVWIGTRQYGLHHWSHNHVIRSVRMEDGLAGNIIRSLLVLPSGEVWIGTVMDRLQRLRKSGLDSLAIPAGSGIVTSFAVSAGGTVWAGTDTGNLLEMRGDLVIKNTLASPNLPYPIRCLCQSGDGSLWLGYAGGGVGRLKAGKFEQFRTGDGLSDDYISQILDDGCGRLWLAGNRGIFCVKQEDFENVGANRRKTLHSVVFGVDEGLPVLQGSWDFWPSSEGSSKDRLLFAMQTGLVIVHPGEMQRRPLPSAAIIENVSVDNQKIADYGPMPTTPGSMVPRATDLRQTGICLKLSKEHEQVSFSFTAPDFDMPESVVFKYRMKGFDKDWIYAGTRRIAYYAHLPPGDYTFQAAACNSAGVWNESDRPIELISEPKFWETIWFRLGIALLSAALIGGTIFMGARFRYRRKVRIIRQQQALEQERARIAQDLHDDLGAGLVEISFGSDLAQDPELESEETREHMREMGTRARELVVALDEIVWAVNPKHDSVTSLADYFCQYAQHFLKATPVRCHLEVARQLPVFPLNAEQRHNLFLAFKEALRNVAQHARATDLWLGILGGDETLAISIADNGVGVDLAVPHKHTGEDGLGNMQRRLRKLGGSCEFSSRPNQGMKVVFRLPLTASGKPFDRNSIEVL